MILPVKVTEHILITLITCTKCHDLYGILAKLIHNIGDQVKSLLVCQTGNDTDHHGLRIFLKA